MSSNRVVLALLAVSSLCVSFESAEALSAHGECARHEFSELKVSGNWQNFIAAGSYAEVEDTGFIALESASDDQRTCLYGFSLNHLDENLDLNAETAFVCFPTGAFALQQLKEFCVDGEPACAIDPAQISIGIGNIEIVEPTLETLGRTNAATVFGRYPSRVSVKIIPETVPSAGGLPLPSQPLKPGLPWTSVPKTLEGIRWGN